MVVAGGVAAGTRYCPTRPRDMDALSFLLRAQMQKSSLLNTYLCIYLPTLMKIGI